MKTIINARTILKIVMFCVLSITISFTAQAYLFLGILSVFMIWNTRGNAQRVMWILSTVFTVTALLEASLMFWDTPSVVYFIVAGVMGFVVRYMMPTYWRDQQ